MKGGDSHSSRVCRVVGLELGSGVRIEMLHMGAPQRQCCAGCRERQAAQHERDDEQELRNTQTHVRLPCRLGSPGA
jgi:hypothetical protein